MEKMRMETTDITEYNINKIAELFPNVITEDVDEEISTPEKKVYKRAINFELLKQELSKDVLEGDEAYEFTWVGKKASIVEANRPIRKTLRPCMEESKDWNKTENLYIEGDNLEVLKLLQESYLGAIKMIYIDPPYNTGSDFLYRDNFNQTIDEYEENVGVFDNNNNRLFKNMDTNGRFHSDWCSMIYPRILHARNLLSDEGVIFISIDDNEVENMRKICSEIFGQKNFIATFIWEKRVTRENRKIISVRHDYILCYVKKYEFRDKAIGLLPMNQEAIDRYKNPDNDSRGVWTSVPAIAQAGHGTKNQFYTLTTPNGRVINPPSGSCWRYTKDKMEEAIEDNRIWFGSDGNGVPRIKKFLNEGRQGLTPETIWMSDNVGTNDSAKRELVTLFDGIAVFETPKPTALLKQCVEICANAEDGVFLDFFSGTAPLAQAVMELNYKKGYKSRFIMVQLPDEIPLNSEAYKAGYRYISDIGKERIRRAGEKIKEEAGLLGQDLDVGFRVFKLDDSNMKDVYYSANEYSQTLLDELASNIKEDRTDLDLLFGCLLEWGLPLSLPYTSEEIEGVTIHTINEGDLIACFADSISENAIKEIAKRQPLRAVFRDSSFASSPEKINIEEIFKLMAPNTSIKVI